MLCLERHSFTSEYVVSMDVVRGVVMSVGEVAMEIGVVLGEERSVDYMVVH